LLVPLENAFDDDYAPVVEVRSKKSFVDDFLSSRIDHGHVLEGPFPP
jgi:hypothetical protein